MRCLQSSMRRERLQQPFAIRDGHLITGQQQFSGAAAAELVIEALGFEKPDSPGFAPAVV